MGFSNEGAVDGGFRPLKNIMGLWIIQECMRQWDSEEKLSWDDIVLMAKGADTFKSLIDVNAHEFYNGSDMPRKIQSFCKTTGQSVPQTKGEIARTVYESLALSYREAFEGLEQLKGHRIDALHIVGGGAQNKLLNKMTAAAINRVVIAGPYEATAIGNLMVQMKAAGEVKDTAQMRDVIRGSFDVEMFEPADTQAWDDRFGRFMQIKQAYKER